MTVRTKKKSTEELLNIIVEGMQEVKAKEIVILDMRGLRNAVADYFVVCHGTSNTQVEAIARSVERFTEQQLNESPTHTEGVRNGQWVLMDYFNIIAHIFDEPSRHYYGLEELWADADVQLVKEIA